MILPCVHDLVRAYMVESDWRRQARQAASAGSAARNDCRDNHVRMSLQPAPGPAPYAYLHCICYCGVIITMPQREALHADN